MTTMTNFPMEEIFLPEAQQKQLIQHSLRKLNGNYSDNETKERKAYGLIGGRYRDRFLDVQLIAPFYRNGRFEGPQKQYMDTVLNEYAEPSETPLDKRAWVADPAETKAILNEMARMGLELVGTYHMHRVAWENDPKREEPTELDTILGKDTGLLMFIVSVVNPDKPVIRAFYEGYPDKEVLIKTD